VVARFRRTAHLTFRVAETRVLDVGELLRGCVDIRREGGLRVRSLLTGEESPLTLDELRLLVEVPESEWVEPADDGAALEGLARRGLVVTDADDELVSGLRARDERFEAAHWHPDAAAYHMATRWRGVDVAAFPDVAAEAVAGGEEHAGRLVDSLGEPPPHFHVVAGALDVTELPLVERTGGVYEALARRKTTRLFAADATLRLEDFSTLLYSVFGCHGTAPLYRESLVLKKTSPSAGSLHPIEVYPLLSRVEGFDAGLYHYRTRDHALELLEPLDADRARELASRFMCGQSYLATAQAVFVMTARFDRSYWKYRRHERAYATLLLDAGHLSQTLYLVAADLRLGAFVTAAINGADIDERLHLEPATEGAIAVCGCGIASDERPELEPDFTPYMPRSG
jgi:putative peptide maturation dehydrogenase